MRTSAIPDAIDALVALAEANTDVGQVFDGVVIFDGPPPDDPSEQVYLCIGDTPDDDSPGVTGEQSFEALGGNSKNEAFTIYCTAISRSGDTNVKAERDRAFAVMGGLERLLRQGEPGSNARLGGVVQWAAIGGEENYTAIQTSKGALVEVGFTIACRARI